jgi:hypothetical protein
METYGVARKGKNWAVHHNGTTEGDYATKEAAFEAIVAAASNAIKDGIGITITIPARAPGEDALGAERQR